METIQNSIPLKMDPNLVIVVDDDEPNDEITKESHEENSSRSGTTESVVEEKKSMEATYNEQSNERPQGPAFHPYLNQLNNFEPPQKLLIKSYLPQKKILPSITTICNREDLLDAVKLWQTESVIALDLYTLKDSYVEKIYIMSVSTQNADYLIDTIKLKDHLTPISEILVNRNIVKVMFQSEPLLSRLQHSLNMFVVNLFDMFEALQVLGESVVTFERRLMGNYKQSSKPQRYDQVVNLSTATDELKNYYRTSSRFLYCEYFPYKNLLLPDRLEQVFQTCTEKCKILFKYPRDVSHCDLMLELEARHQHEEFLFEKLNDWHENAINTLKSPVLPLDEFRLLVRYFPMGHETGHFCPTINKVPSHVPMVQKMHLKNLLDTDYRSKFFVDATASKYVYNIKQWKRKQHQQHQTPIEIKHSNQHQTATEIPKNVVRSRNRVWVKKTVDLSSSRASNHFPTRSTIQSASNELADVLRRLEQIAPSAVVLLPDGSENNQIPSHSH